MKVPFIVPEEELNLRLVRILIIVKELTYNRNIKPFLDDDKVGVYDFLIRYPVVFNRILIENNFKDNIKLKEIEEGSISDIFPQKRVAFEYSKIKKIIIRLYSYGFISVINESKGIMYEVTEEGVEFLETIDSEYILRVEELAKYLYSLKSISFSKLNNMINLTIGGENE